MPNRAHAAAITLGSCLPPPPLANRSGNHISAMNTPPTNWAVLWRKMNSRPGITLAWNAPRMAILSMEQAGQSLYSLPFLPWRIRRKPAIPRAIMQPKVSMTAWNASCSSCQSGGKLLARDILKNGMTPQIIKMTANNKLLRHESVAHFAVGIVSSLLVVSLYRDRYSLRMLSLSVPLLVEPYTIFNIGEF